MRDHVEAVRPDLLEQTIELVGEDPFARVDESTRYAQPAILCASLAGWAQLRDHVEPVALAGHSLGEFGALSAADALSEHDALRLVALRGRLMADAGEASGGGTMLALLGATPEQAAELAAQHDVTVANDNAPDQVVLSGAPDDLDRVRQAADEAELRARPLDVAGAFHSPQMADAVEPLREALAEVEMRPPRITVFSCASAAPFEDPVSELADAVVHPVRWRETMEALSSHGAQTFVEVGPGRVLTKLAPRCVPDVTATPLEKFLERTGATV